MIPNIQALRERYRSLDTDALKALWCRDERMPWAEQVLRRELLERGVTGEEIDELVFLRPAIERATAVRIGHEEFSVFGPIGALMIGIALAAIANAVSGWRAAVIVAMGVAIVFAYFMQRFVRYKFAHAPGGISLAAVKGVISLLAIACGLAYGVVVLLQ